MQKRILFLTQWFDPEPTFKGLLFAEELAKKGFIVEVVTGFPNYPTGVIYDGYKIKLIQRETINGVNITRVPLYANHGYSALKRALNYISFAFSITIYCVFFAKKANVIYAYHPPLTVGIAAIIVRFFRKVPVVYDVQDMWPDTLKATGMLNNKRALNFIAHTCKWVYKRVDFIVVLSPGFKRLLIERGVSEKKIELIYNWADEKSLIKPKGVLPNEFPSSDNFRIVFAGNMGKAQALDAVINAALILQSKSSTVCFVFIGGGVEAERLAQRTALLKLKNVLFFAAVPMNEIGTYLNAADALLVHLRADPLFEITIPSKTQAYMSVGKPILMAVGGDAAELVSLAGVGVIAKSEDALSIADAAEQLMNQSPSTRDVIGRKAQEYYSKNLSSIIGIEKFTVVLNAAIMQVKD